MSRRRRKALPPKRERKEAAALGGSEVARQGRLGRPGGAHDRRRTPRRVERQRAIQEAS